jgi:hypothetical protein
MKFLLIIFDGEDRHFKHIGSYFQYELKILALNLVINLISKNYLNLTLINSNETYF